MWNWRAIGFGAGLCALALWGPAADAIQAHCDGLDGPVVKAATRALATGNVNFAVIWVQPKDEAEVKAAFAETIAVRRHGPQAQHLADRAFFESVVRLHRAGEGASYDGLKPAGRDLGPAIPAADRAIAAGDLAGLDAILAHALREGLEARYDRVRAARDYDPNDVAAGRAYVAAYVAFVHYAERLYETAAQDAPDHSHRD
jgi:hypothetical protein